MRSDFRFGAGAMDCPNMDCPNDGEDVKVRIRTSARILPVRYLFTVFSFRSESVWLRKLRPFERLLFRRETHDERDELCAFFRGDHFGLKFGIEIGVLDSALQHE